jgi:hypothetical protein
LGIKYSSGYRRAGELKKYIRSHAENFAIGHDDLSGMIEALDNLTYSDNVDSDLYNIEQWMIDSLKSDVKKNAVDARKSLYANRSHGLEDVIKRIASSRGGQYHAGKFYDGSSDSKKAEIAGASAPVRQRDGNLKFARGSIGHSI